VATELILVAEDNDKSRKLVRDVLTVKGYEIIEAETGEEGVGLAQERRPSLILMDIRLPGIDGIQALGRLRAEGDTREIPVVCDGRGSEEGVGRRVRRLPEQTDQDERLPGGRGTAP
jgi:CheY-like chemotaxis protein